jgi:co-chaperonin GroES (HSP10)
MIVDGIATLVHNLAEDAQFQAAAERYQRESISRAAETLKQQRDSEALASKPMAAWLNPTEFEPTEFKVLVLPDEVDDTLSTVKVGDSEVKIYKPDSAKEREMYSMTLGTIIAVSPLAFSYSSAEEWAAAGASKPAPGERVYYAKHAGARVKSKRDGKDYLLLNDKDVVAKLKD